MPFAVSLDVLRSDGGQAGESLADAFGAFPWRKFHWAIRALLQNSAVLADHGYSFRGWLEAQCKELGESGFPPPNFQATVEPGNGPLTLERALRRRLEQNFYMVGPALSAYMLSDWQLWLWRQGRTRVFATFKLDSFHEDFVRRFGRGVIPVDEVGFSKWWLAMYRDIPPRIPNECIWLGIERKVL